MKSKKSTLIIDKSERLSKASGLWDKAIADSQELIRQAESEIARLRQSIRMLTELKRSGARFPGESQSEASQ